MKYLLLAACLATALALSGCDTILAGAAQLAGTAVVGLW